MITTMSAFFYGHKINQNNYFFDFQESGDVLVGQIAVGDYTPETMCSALELALNSAGEQTYTASFDRTTRKITLSADSNFSILISSGVNKALSAYSLLGFTGSADLTGAASYVGASVSASLFLPQIPLQRYTPFTSWLSPTGAKLNVSASGSKIEVISYGEQRFMEFELPYITNLNTGTVIEHNSNGVSNYIDFIEYAITKSILQFVPDRSTPATYFDCILESTPESRDGTTHKLKEMLSRSLAGYYDSGRLVFRKIE